METKEFLKTLSEQVSKSEIELDKIMKEIEKARAIGLDVKELMSKYDSQRKQIELVKEVYKL